MGSRPCHREGREEDECLGRLGMRSKAIPVPSRRDQRGQVVRPPRPLALPSREDRRYNPTVAQALFGQRFPVPQQFFFQVLLGVMGQWP